MINAYIKKKISKVERQLYPLPETNRAGGNFKAARRKLKRKKERMNEGDASVGEYEADIIIWSSSEGLCLVSPLQGKALVNDSCYPCASTRISLLFRVSTSFCCVSCFLSVSKRLENQQNRTRFEYFTWFVVKIEFSFNFR